MRAPLLLAVAITLLTWSSAYAAIRHAVHGFPPGALALIRFGTASVVLAAYVLASRRRAFPRLLAHDAPGFAGVGLIGIAIYHVALNAVERTVGAGAASLLINTAPIWTALIATAFLRERLGARGWAGMLIAFVGTVLVSVDSAGGIRFEGDVAWVLLASVATAVYFVLQKPYLTRYGALDATCYAIWFGTLFLLPFAPECARAIRTASGGEIASALYLGVAPGAIGYLTWTYTLSKLPAFRAASLLYMVPPLAFLVAWIALGETPGVLALVGGFPILVGVALVNSGRAATAAGTAAAGTPSSATGATPSATTPARKAASRPEGPPDR
jgi:drug/metabolite transporter (DMT)-like permease